MKFIQLFLQKLPLCIGAIPYHLSFYAAKFLLQNGQARIWARNSYALKRLNPGISDIDFTFLFKASYSNHEIKKKISHFQKWRKYFPLWGEVNSYREDELKRLAPFFNPYERQRDLKLQESLQLKFENPNLENKFVYILRMLKADEHNLKKYPELRKKKWIYHFQQVGIPYSTQLIEPIITELIRPLNLSLNEQIFKEFLRVDETLDQEVDQFYLPLSPNERASFILIFPLRWLVVSLRNHQFDQDLALVRVFNKNEQKLLLEHLRWELMGIFSQYHQMALTCDLSKHMANIEKLLENLSHEEASLLKTAYQELDRFIKNYRQE